MPVNEMDSKTIFGLDKNEFDIKYFGGGDFAGGFFARVSVDNLSYLEGSLDILNGKITDIHGLYQFFWKRAFREFADDLAIYKISDDDKTRIRTLADKLIEDKGGFVSTINGSFSVVFDKRNHSEHLWSRFFGLAFDACYGEFSGSLKPEVFAFIETNFQWKIFNSFDVCLPYYKKHEAAFESLLSRFKSQQIQDTGIIVTFLLNYKDRICPDAMKSKAEQLCIQYLPYFSSKCSQIDDQEIVFDKEIEENFANLARLYRLQCGNEYNRLKAVYLDSVDQYILKHGQQYTSESVDLKPVLEAIKGNDGTARFLMLTHGRTKEGLVVNNMDSIINEKQPNPLTELFDHRPKSTTYPLYKQDVMDIFLSVSAKTLLLVLEDEALQQSLPSFVHSIASEVGDKAFYQKFDLGDECLGDLILLLNSFAIWKKNTPSSPTYLAICNACVVNTIATIEKILRCVYVSERFDIQYVDESKTTIATYLEEGAIGASLSSGLKYFLRYYLSCETSQTQVAKMPGQNWRNIQMHDLGDKYAKTDLSTCLSVFFFLLSLLGDVFLNRVKAETK
jgi:hypothetical protein